jgi:hypothetical protein
MRKKPEKETLRSIEVIMSYLQTRDDVGGFVIQKNKEEDTLEFDGYFSDEFLGKTPQETFETLAVVIAAMRNMSDSLTKRLAQISGISEDVVKQKVSELYYEIRKTEKTTLETIKEDEPPKQDG